ncbi:uncharacterized protein LOC123448525 isoform X2 [Hordeum vulgare subsp. vulgare]|uniref:uncharacterized protein LOC123448525 isoform X2 n=1 Tax=Hordeum vulgare subsp. vulgare TaxID=112509 RepID=UPI001D1A51EB|nr:uncharacterized protein LOC123448525 isoform X2 [Hordeum vulgare subsp. vulgare]
MEGRLGRLTREGEIYSLDIIGATPRRGRGEIPYDTHQFFTENLMNDRRGCKKQGGRQHARYLASSSTRGGGGKNNWQIGDMSELRRRWRTEGWQPEVDDAISFSYQLYDTLNFCGSFLYQF